MSSQPVSHVWFGDYSALYLEIGDLTHGQTRNPTGRFTIYAGFDWRLGYLGATSARPASALLAEHLIGTTVVSASIGEDGHELEVGFSNGLRLMTFSQGEPDWCVSFRSGATMHLCIEHGSLKVDRRDF